jgi:hypothetical protein
VILGKFGVTVQATRGHTMPLTFLLLSLPISIGIFMIVFGIAVLHDMFVEEPRKSERRIALPNKRHNRLALTHYVPRRKRHLAH